MADSGFNRRCLRIVWLIAILVVIVGSLLPANSGPMQTLGRLQISDKLLHFLAYATLSFLPTLHERWPVLALVVAGAVMLGVGLEFAQMLSPGRSFEIADMLANAIGALGGLVAALPWRAGTASLNWN
jgi:VanZ family protein